MSLVASEMTPADIAAVSGGNCNDGFMNNGSWLIILFLFVILGWGNGGWGGNNGANGNGFVPYYLANNTDNGVQAGFNNAAIAGQLSGIQGAITSGFSTAEVAACNRAMNDLERSFASQTAITQGMTNLSSQLADCCCENRLASADLKYTIATENCADRAALSDGIRDVIASQAASTQKILDKLCEQEIQAKNDLIGQLRQEVLFARGQASQIAQNEQIVNQIYNRLDTCPVGTTPVYGRTPIFTCNQNSGCGCNGNFYN